MNFRAVYLLSIDDLPKPKNEDTRRVRIRQHRGIARVLLIEAGQMIQVGRL